MAGGAAALAACAPAEPSAEPVETASPDATEEVSRPQMNVIAGSFYHLTGEDRRLAFGLSDLDNEPVRSSDVRVEIRDVETGDVRSGPVTADFHDDLGEGLGLYIAYVDLPEAGSFVAHVDTGEVEGEQAISVNDPEDSEVPAPGDDAIAVETPTTEDDLGLEALCTQDPPCGMHEMSLEEALEEQLPIVLLFATPAYCQTAVCAPAVELLDEVRESSDWGDAVFIHAEIFIDNGVTVADHVYDWDLPSEPWLFAIDRDGRVADRVDGAILRIDADKLTREVT